MLARLQPVAFVEDRTNLHWVKYITLLMGMDPIFCTYTLSQLEKRWNPTAPAGNINENMLGSLLAHAWNDDGLLDHALLDSFTVNEVWNLFQVIAEFFSVSPYVFQIHLGSPCTHSGKIGPDLLIFPH
jgi:hypothetical protein